MKVTIKKTNTEEVEIPLPFYCRHEYHFFQITEKGCLMVFPDKDSAACKMVSKSLPFESEYKEITAADFNKAFTETYKHLSSL